MTNTNRVAAVPDLVRVTRAIVSAADKTGLAELAGALASACDGITLYATGASHAFLKEALAAAARARPAGERGRPVDGKAKGGASLVSVSAYTGQPEMQGGLVKTLDYKIYLGLLAEPANAAHESDLARVGAVAFDLVVCNLYPFEATVAGGGAGVTLEDARANIDIGGVTLLRAAAKNFLRVAVLCDPADYDEVSRELERNGGALTLSHRFRLARKAFARTAAYDAAIARYLESAREGEALAAYAILGGDR